MGRKKKDSDKNDAAPACSSGHALARRTASDCAYECDVCTNDIAAGVCFFGCTPCDYSLCNPCYIKVATGEITASKPSPEPPADCITGARIDPDVAELCEHFEIEDRILLKLNEIMKTRQDTFSGDMEKLWSELSTARSPAGLLMAKIKQMGEGTFVGKIKAPPDVQKLIDKFRLDHDARTKLTGFTASRPDTRSTDLYEIERRLETSNNPSATVMMMIVKLHKGEKLPEPLRGTPHRDFADLKDEDTANGNHSSRKDFRDRPGRDEMPDQRRRDSTDFMKQPDGELGRGRSPSRNYTNSGRGRSRSRGDRGRERGRTHDYDRERRRSRSRGYDASSSRIAAGSRT